MELFLVAMARLFKNKQKKKKHKIWMKHHAATLNKYSTENEGAQVGGKWGKLFIWFQTSPPCRDRKLRKGMN